MNESMLKAMVAAGAIKKINIIASGARGCEHKHQDSGGEDARNHERPVAD